MCLQMPLAQDELLLMQLWEATMTGIRRRFLTKPLFPGCQHQSVIGADRIIIMQGDDDLRLWQDALHQEDHVDAHHENRMEMDDIVAKGAEQVGKFRYHTMHVDLRQIEAVEMPGPHQHLVRGGTDALEDGPRALLAMGLIDAADEQALGRSIVLHLTKQVAGENFGAAWMQGRVIVTEMQNVQFRLVGHHHDTTPGCNSKTQIS